MAACMPASCIMTRNLLNDSQSGFRTQHSCETALNYMVHKWAIAIDKILVNVRMLYHGTLHSEVNQLLLLLLFIYVSHTGKTFLPYGQDMHAAQDCYCSGILWHCYCSGILWHCCDSLGWRLDSSLHLELAAQPHSHSESNVQHQKGKWHRKAVDRFQPHFVI